MKKQQALSFLQSSIVFLLGLVVLVMPLIITSGTTDAILLPKKVFVIACALLALLAWGIMQVIQKALIIHKSPISIFLSLFVLVSAISTFLSVSVYESAAWTVPVFCASVLAFLMTQMLLKKEQVQFVLMSAGISVGILSLINIAGYFHIYLLPVSFTHSAGFTPFGTLIDQAVLFLAALAICVRLFVDHIRRNASFETVLLALGGFVFLAGFTVTTYLLFTTQKPIILPFVAGFQISFAAISQDSTRLLQSFLFGSGPDTYYMDFARFKQASFNADNNLWFLPFGTSTTFLLGSVAMLGLFGISSLLALMSVSLTQMKKNLSHPLVPGVAILLAGITFLPVTFGFFLLVLFALALLEVALRNARSEKDVLEISLVTKHNQQFNFSSLLPIGVLLLLLIIGSGIAWATTTYTLSDVYFQQSLVAAQSNNANVTYKKQIDAITMFPYRDVYYRVFAQTNMTLANTLVTVAASQKNGSPSAQLQQQTLQLIQQSITSARTATTLSPYNPQNWKSLGAIYQMLIGFGQNADSFSLTSFQEETVLDPTNPQAFLDLGGVYYAAKQWDNAIKAYQTAVSLKPDYANAYYNLGHAYEEKGDLANALQAYQAVQQLVQGNAANAKTITADISNLQQKMQSTGTQKTEQTKSPAPTPEVTPAAQNQQPLQIQTPASSGSAQQP